MSNEEILQTAAAVAIIVAVAFVIQAYCLFYINKKKDGRTKTSARAYHSDTKRQVRNRGRK